VLVWFSNYYLLGHDDWLCSEVVEERAMKLTGDRCQCAACDEYFNSTSAFNKHRRGKHTVKRYCLSPTEMINKGMAKNKAGFWVASLPNAQYLAVRRAGKPKSDLI
jgi:hypothetical protein